MKHYKSLFVSLLYPVICSILLVIFYNPPAGSRFGGERRLFILSSPFPAFRIAARDFPISLTKVCSFEIILRRNYRQIVIHPRISKFRTLDGMLRSNLRVHI
ncbi:hypothetical protein IQ07DRAFT_382438 [Pyrenochaeta sp. DS3sAY3a]|nr:hypothetical protein IQ07DRAFT_382438 [Pyrenochaeta sp. DS3sAY3a]